MRATPRANLRAKLLTTWIWNIVSQAGAQTPLDWADDSCSLLDSVASLLSDEHPALISMIAGFRPIQDWRTSLVFLDNTVTQSESYMI